MTADPASTLLRSSITAHGYDVLNRLLWLPSGSDRLRRDLVGALELTPGMKVLELGCGTGLVTRHLLEGGAQVTAVDGSEVMLSRARRRAPGGAYLRAGVLDADAFTTGPFDRVVLSFLLHELDQTARVEVLRRSLARITPTGRIGILEWGQPDGALRRRLWRSVVGIIEPAVAQDILDRGLDDAIDATSLAPILDVGRAGGRARLVVAGIR
jgi:demethylmenaquinone methyltransferase / 2-methoxy-6-polyprenyl-1,4-benzoquinol methylase